MKFTNLTATEFDFTEKCHIAILQMTENYELKVAEKLKLI